MTKPANACRYFLRCTRVATTTVPNPILGDVPCCTRCAATYRRLTTGKA